MCRYKSATATGPFRGPTIDQSLLLVNVKYVKNCENGIRLAGESNTKQSRISGPFFRAWLGTGNNKSFSGGYKTLEQAISND